MILFLNLHVFSRSAAKGLKDSSQARAFKITGSPGQSVEEDADLVVIICSR